jgi:hypothetical protein
LLVALPLAALALEAPAGAKVLLTQDEALTLAFPGCHVERKTQYLTPAQMQEAEKLAGEPMASAIVHRYQGRCPQAAPGKAPGTSQRAAYFDTHRVRTLAETLMVVVDAEGKVERLEVLAFKEPPDYLPRPIWYGQFLGKPLDEGLALKREIRGVTGATLTARATTSAVRRVLALHQVLQEAKPESLETGPDAKPAPLASSPTKP